MNTEERIKKLKIQLDELVLWKDKHIKQQIQDSIDARSLQLIQQDFLITTGEYAGEIVPDVWLEIETDGIFYWIAAIEN